MSVSSLQHPDEPAGVDLLTHPLLEAVPNVVHGFTTRRGGTSLGALSALNLALRPGEHPERLVENWRRVCAALGGDLERLVLLDQVHGDRVVEASVQTGPLETLGEADAMVTTRRGLLLAIRTADCVPVLLAAERVVGAVHAGWRGVAGRVTERAVERLCSLGGVTPAQVRAVVGPCISGPAYQVDDVVAEALRAAGGSHGLTADGPGHHLADLRGMVEAQLHRAGVQRVGHVSRCTAADPWLYSHRANGPSTGRLASVIGLC